MKINLSILTVLLFIAFTSCNSDKLTKQKITELYKECSEKGNTQYAEKRITLGSKTTLNTHLKPKNSEENYMEFKEQGLINFQKLETSFMGYPQYKISLTEKGENYISKTKKDGTWTKTWVKCFSLELDEIIEIHEIPAQNIATIKITLKKVNKTPFIILMNKENNDSLIEKTIGLKKTNEGWKLCNK
jgi:hypothetical protein